MGKKNFDFLAISGKICYSNVNKAGRICVRKKGLVLSMDNYCEYIVKRKNVGKDLAVQLLTVVAAIVAFMLLMTVAFTYPSVMPITFALACGALYGGYYLLTSQSVEYEYIVTNGEMDVDKIIARRKRKRLVTVKARTFEAFGTYKPAEHANAQYTNRIYACGNINATDNYYAVMNHAKLGRTLLVFSPNDRILSALKPYISRQAGGDAAYGARPDAD